MLDPMCIDPSMLSGCLSDIADIEQELYADNHSYQADTLDSSNAPDAYEGDYHDRPMIPCTALSKTDQDDTETYIKYLEDQVTILQRSTSSDEGDQAEFKRFYEDWKAHIDEEQGYLIKGKKVVLEPKLQLGMGIQEVLARNIYMSEVGGPVCPGEPAVIANTAAGSLLDTLDMGERQADAWSDIFSYPQDLVHVDHEAGTSSSADTVKRNKDADLINGESDTKTAPTVILLGTKPKRTIGYCQRRIQTLSELYHNLAPTPDDRVSHTDILNDAQTDRGIIKAEMDRIEAFILRRREQNRESARTRRWRERKGLEGRR